MIEDWSFLEEAAGDLEIGDTFDLASEIATLLADRVVSSVAGETRDLLAVAQTALERFYLTQADRAPSAAVLAAQGDADPKSPEAAAFMLGIIGFAHATVARVASKRIDDNFERRLTARPFEQYVRMLIDEELSGRQIADRLQKDEAEVSRRLKVLRQMGAVDCRREGNRVVNFLTPAARAVVRSRNMGALQAGTIARPLTAAVSDALDDQRHQLSPELQRPMLLVFPGERMRGHCQ